MKHESRLAHHFYGNELQLMIALGNQTVFPDNKASLQIVKLLLIHDVLWITYIENLISNISFWPTVYG